MHGIGQLLYILTIPKVTYALQSWSHIFRRRNSLKEITENTLKIVGKGGGVISWIFRNCFKRKTTTIFISLSVVCGPNRNINRCIFCICKILLIPAECRVQKYIKGMKVDTCLVDIKIPKDEGKSFNTVVPRIYWSVIQWNP